MIAHHLGKYLPGKPAVIVQHMPGAAYAFANTGSANYRRLAAALAWPKATEFFSRHLVG
ncbi:MAG: dienelactone hydrolase family protein [Deltaproteobacteria bacterium]|nr:dienelactone hydrolase family protein [Deltaproteobacteria bacterium]MDZ4347037.1 dienelactone hydrolase family protein [Candidatus Binatia bacterium]